MQQTGNDNKFDEIEDNFEEADNIISEEEERRNSERRRRRREEMRRIKRQQELIRKRAIPLGVAVIILLVIIISASVRSCHKSDNTSAGNDLDIQTQSSHEDISGNTGNDVTVNLEGTSENTNESVTGAADGTTTIGEEETTGTSDDIVDSTKEEVNDNIEDNEQSGSSMIDESQLSDSGKMTEMSENEKPNKNTTVQAKNILSGVSGNVLYESIIGTITNEASTQAQTGAVFNPQSNADTTSLPGDVISTNGIVVDVDTGVIVAQRDCDARISPASMTKILTVLVAAEHVDNLDDAVTITRDITDYSFSNECSNVGFDVDETVTVRDLFYGTILPSGADAALALATYVAGSHEAFVDMMNDKLEELGISDTAHFTNCVGLYDENHYCTVYDMAVILKAAIDNELSKEVLSAHTYTTSKTEQHPDGMILSNWFLRRIEDKDTHGEVVCAKTGYVLQSGSCSASYAENENGKRYICVTAHSSSSWRCIYDHVAIYEKFM